jgi:hypothetical protein
MFKFLVWLLLIFITGQASSYEIFKFDKKQWQYFNGLKSLSIKQPFIVNKVTGAIGIIFEEVLPSDSKITLQSKCNNLSKNNIFNTTYCKIQKKNEVSFLFEKNFKVGTMYQMVTFRNQSSKGIIAFEKGLK